MLGFFFRHYDSWVDRYVVFDDGSTDGSLKLLRAHPRVEVRPFKRTFPDSFVDSQRELYDHVWKESRELAEWVVITAIDEHLCVPGRPMRDYLEASRRQGTTLVPALGYQMVSDELPGPEEVLCWSRTRGAPWHMMNKLSLWNPNAIEETHFARGRHTAAPTGRLQLPRRDELLLLHYKYLGFERTLARHAAQRGGLGPQDLAKQLGYKYSWSREQLREDWDRVATGAVDISSPDLRPWDSHLERRWWRPNLKRRLKRKAVALWAGMRGHG